MSDRARDFLDHWLSGHVEAVPDAKRMQETVRLVAMCRKDAISAGIPPDELRAAAEGDLIRNVLAAVAAANENEPPDRPGDGADKFAPVVIPLFGSLGSARRFSPRRFARASFRASKA